MVHRLSSAPLYLELARPLLNGLALSVDRLQAAEPVLHRIQPEPLLPRQLRAFRGGRILTQRLGELRPGKRNVPHGPAAGRPELALERALVFPERPGDHLVGMIRRLREITEERAGEELERALH